MSQMICDIICILSDTYFMKHHNFGPIRHRRIWIRFDWLVKQLKWFFTPCWSCLIINSSGWILIFILNSSKIHEIPVKKTVWSLTTVSVTAFSGQNCYPSYYIIDITRSVSELYFGWTSCFLPFRYCLWLLIWADPAPAFQSSLCLQGATDMIFN